MNRFNSSAASIVFLWGSSISYIFYDAYHTNNHKKKYNQMIRKNITEKSSDSNYNKFEDKDFNPFRSL